MEDIQLPRNFRKADIRERRDILLGMESLQKEAAALKDGQEEWLDLAEVMVESAVGVMPLPLGIASGFIINGKKVNIPMATEEPSVIAAANYGGQTIALSGGFTAQSTEPIMIQQVFVEGASPEEIESLNSKLEEISTFLEPQLSSMTKRGGGLRGITTAYLKESNVYRIHLLLDVQDAMGANLLNTVGEAFKQWITDNWNAKVVMTILSNNGENRRAQARFELPIRRLGRGGLPPQEVADRLIRASLIAKEDPYRAVTHNKGIMNGVSALAAATGNDTRAIEASFHAFAARNGQYSSMTSYRLEGDKLIGEIDMPILFGSVGGALGFHPVSRWSMNLLGNPTARELGEVAACLGLAQNFAAMHALVSEGIQKGHMRLHAARIAYSLGARGEDLSRLQEVLFKEKAFSMDQAKKFWPQENKHV